MADWLALHGVSAAQMQACLASGSAQLKDRYVDGHKADPLTPHDLSPEAAWDLCAQALLAQLDPDLTPAITRMHSNTRLVLGTLPKAGPRALTLPDGGDGNPLISCPFDGLAKDLITLVHEMGHAVQIIASAGKLMPPVLREVCAFTAEEALLAHIAQSDHALYAPLRTAWRRETRRILCAPLRALSQALADPETPYDYTWNYPPARSLSAPNQPLKALFDGDLQLNPVLSRNRP